MKYDITINYCYFGMPGNKEDNKFVIKDFDLNFPIRQGTKLFFKDIYLGEVVDGSIVDSYEKDISDSYEGGVFWLETKIEDPISSYFASDFEKIYNPWKKQKEAEKYAKEHPIMEKLNKIFS